MVASIPRPALSRAFDLAALFSSRIGAIIANLIAIPVYVILLSPSEFGRVALILSAQNFFLFFDFGLGAAIGREVAAAHGTGDAIRLASIRRYRRRVEFRLWALAAVISLLALTVRSSQELGQGMLLVSATAPLLAILIAQNIVQLSLNAMGRFASAAGMNLGSVLLRTGLAVAIVAGPRPDALGFAAAHLAGGIVMFLLGRATLATAENRFTGTGGRFTDDHPVGRMSRASLLLMIYTLGGAAALNLDKPLVSAFFSLADAGRYFLATTYALVPVGLLSGPLYQFYQPQLASAWAAADRHQIERLAAEFQLLTVLAVALPATLLFVDADFWLSLWLRNAADIDQVASLARPVLAGAAVGATGYLPTAVLIAAGDNKFLACASAGLAVAVLLAALLAAISKSLMSVVVAYGIFHAAGCCVLWFRMKRHWPAETLGPLVLRSYIAPGMALVVTGLALTFSVSFHARIPDQMMVAAIGAVMVLSAVLWVWTRTRRFGKGQE